MTVTVRENNTVSDFCKSAFGILFGIKFFYFNGVGSNIADK